MAQEKIEIDLNKTLNPGDVIELHFRSVGMIWLKATQIALIEWRIAMRKDFEILSWSIPEKTRVIFTVRVKQTNPVAVTAGIIAAAIIAAGVMAWLTLDKIYQIMESPAGTAVVSSTAFTFAGLVVGILLLLTRKK